MGKDCCQKCDQWQAAVAVEQWHVVAFETRRAETDWQKKIFENLVGLGPNSIALVGFKNNEVCREC